MSDLSSADPSLSGQILPGQTALPPVPPRPPRHLRWRIFRSVGALVLREMTTTYGRSPGGYIWAILEPVAGIAVMSLAFSLIMRNAPLGTSFPLFFATGTMCFGLYNSIAGVTAGSIQYSRAFLAYPAVSYMDSLIARILLDLLTHLVIMVIVFTGIIWIGNLSVMIDWGAVSTALGMAIVMGIGVGSVNCYLFNMFPLWRQLWGVITQPMFLASGVIFIPENMPEYAREILMYNPLMHATSEMRKGFYPTYDAIHVVPFYPFAVGLVLIVFGLLLLFRYHKDIILR